ncbi:MAG TPA: extracellular solute-binding protein [Paenibacillus sp.]
MKNEDVDFEVVRTRDLNAIMGDKTYEEAYDELIERERPDILMLNPQRFQRYVADGKLAELDPFMVRDKYDIDGFLPGMVDELRQIGGDKLYGLAPQFYGTAVYYNKDLFTKYGVELPHNGMTWEEIVDLAQHFPSDGGEQSRIYGLASYYPPEVEWQALVYSTSAGLTTVNPDTMQVTINTESWKKVYELALETIKSKAIYTPGEGGPTKSNEDEYYKSQPFIMGHAAMTVATGSLLPELKKAKTVVKGYTPFEIGLAAGPADPADPGTIRENTLGEIFAINANASNKDAAWEFIKFVNSNEFARIHYSNPSSLKTRTGAGMKYDGIDLSAFYTLKIKLNNNSNSKQSKIPDAFHSEFRKIQDREIQSVLDGNKSLNKALEAMQSKGQEVLDLALRR